MVDSNFQVRITANIADLQRSIKEAQATLRELKGISDSTSDSFNKMSNNANKVGAEMNRARLATFAFGQVIRDAGFFSQSFGLGVLAISNNIPILIDQLVLLSGVSAGFGAALSLVGSALAAALTVFAYWAQGVERDGGTVSGAINKMANDSESSIGKLVKYLSTPPASEILGKAVEGVRQGMDAVKKIIDAGVKLAIALWERFGPAVMIALDSFFSMAKNVMLISLNLLRLGAAIVQGDWTKALNAIGNIGKLVFNNLIEFAQAYIGLVTKGLGAIIKLYDPLKGTMLQVAGQEVVKLGDSFKFATEELGGFDFDLLKLINDIFSASSATDQATGKTATYASVMAELRDEIERLDYTFTGTFGDKQEARIKAFQSAIEGLRKLGFEATSKEVQALASEIGSLVNQQEALNTTKNPLRQAGVTQGQRPLGAGNVQGFNIATGDLSLGPMYDMLTSMIPTVGELMQSIVSQIGNGMVEIIDTFTNGIGQLISGQMGIGEFGNTMINSIGRFLSQLGKQMIAFGVATIAFGKARKAIMSGNPAAMIAGGGTLIAAGAALSLIGGVISGLAGGSGGATASASTPIGSTFGGIRGATAFPASTSAMSINSALSNRGVLETRVSGNDLVILMNRATNNRNEYF